MSNLKSRKYRDLEDIFDGFYKEYRQLQNQFSKTRSLKFKLENNANTYYEINKNGLPENIIRQIKRNTFRFNGKVSKKLLESYISPLIRFLSNKAIKLSQQVANKEKQIVNIRKKMLAIEPSRREELKVGIPYSKNSQYGQNQNKVSIQSITKVLEKNGFVSPKGFNTPAKARSQTITIPKKMVLNWLSKWLSIMRRGRNRIINGAASSSVWQKPATYSKQPITGRGLGYCARRSLKR